MEFFVGVSRAVIRWSIWGGCKKPTAIVIAETGWDVRKKSSRLESPAGVCVYRQAMPKNKDQTIPGAVHFMSNSLKKVQKTICVKYE